MDSPPTSCNMAQAVKPVANRAAQVVFYDWGIGTDQHTIADGMTGVGIDKNITDCYRFIIHNFNPGINCSFSDSAEARIPCVRWPD